MNTRRLAVWFVGMGLVVGCGDNGKSESADAAEARDTSGTLDVRKEPDVAQVPDAYPALETGRKPDAADASQAQCPPPETRAPFSDDKYPFYCARGGIGSGCDDMLYPPECIAGEWTCGKPEFGPPRVRADQCACFGIGCTLIDAGAPDAKDATIRIPEPDAQGTSDTREAGSAGCLRTETGGGYPYYCARGSAGSICDDVTFPPQCIAGQWDCGKPEFGPPYVRADQCACFGVPPVRPGMDCKCGDRGWECVPNDAGASDAKDAPISDLRADL